MEAAVRTEQKINVNEILLESKRKKKKKKVAIKCQTSSAAANFESRENRRNFLLPRGISGLRNRMSHVLPMKTGWM